jgi:hypothetical protein
VYWKPGQKTPRCLVTNCRWRLVEDYALRFWHEQSFRDLKSAGFQWNQSAVWSPTHAHRLLFILAVANAWVMAQGLLHAPPEKPSPSRTCPPLSLFQRGLRWVHETLKVGPLWPFSPDLAFTLPQPLLC